MQQSILLGLMLTLGLVGGTATTQAQESPHQSLGFKPTAIPLVNFSSDDGTGYGLRFYLYEYDGHSVPYRRAYSAQAFFTSQGKWVHRLFVDMPQLRPGHRVEVEAVFEKEEFANYYGNLTDAEVDNYTRPQKTFQQASPQLQLRWIRDLRAPWRLKAGLSVNHTRIETNTEQGSLLSELNPLGADGGTLFKLNTSLRYDSRDNYNNTRRGIFEELSVVYGIGGGGDFNGAILSYEHRHFLPLGQALVLAHRANGDLSFGDVPFYQELQLGGSSTVRGLSAARERGSGRLLFNTELRWRGIALSKRQSIYLGANIFADVGQIFAREQGPALNDWRTSAGGGLRFYWQSTIVRADYGHTGDRAGLYITFSQVF